MPRQNVSSDRRRRAIARLVLAAALLAFLGIPSVVAGSERKERRARAEAAARLRKQAERGGPASGESASADGGVASPAGTTYSVEVGLGVGDEVQIDCSTISLCSVGVDNVVTFDHLEEEICSDPLETVPSVSENVSVTPDGTFFVVIQLRSPAQTDLFPGGFVDPQGQEFVHACLTIGSRDPLAWPGLDTVTAATLELLTDGVVQVGPLDVTRFFPRPWNGLLNVVVPNAAGEGYNGARLQFLVDKTAVPPNDACVNAASVTDGSFEFDNIGATTDGPEEPAICLESDDAGVRADVWYEYTATCTGELKVDVCDSFYDTKLAVYEGCNVCPPADDPIACNDDAPLCGSLGQQSEVSVTVEEGTCYTLRVGGFLGDQGRGTMRIECASGACCLPEECVDGLTEGECLSQQGQWFADEVCDGFTCPPGPPANDLCSGCIPVQTGVPFHGSTEGAGTDGQSFCVTNDAIDVWHCWTADCTGWATFSLCGSSFDTTLAVYDACDGHELLCEDDGCTSETFLASQFSMIVEEGTTYVLRVAGLTENHFGDYTLTVSPCQVGCCNAIGLCGFVSDEPTCEAVPGTPLDPSLPCRQRDINRNGRDDACEPCPAATVAAAVPVDGTIDARQPHRASAGLPTFGIGAPGSSIVPREPILVTLDPPVTGAAHCFRLCENGPEPGGGRNDIRSVVDLGGGQYEITFQRPITIGTVTTIRYLNDAAFVEYISHPANVDGGPAADVDDILELLDCCILGLCAPSSGQYSCDLDRSGGVSTADLLMGIDLLRGAGAFGAWEDTPRPVNAICP